MNLPAVERLIKPVEQLGNEDSRRISETLDEAIERRFDFLKDYQSRRYARRYRRLVEKVAKAEASVIPGAKALTDSVARSLFKLMAYKDEYEVARLHNLHTWNQVKSQVGGENLRLEFHLAPPLFARIDKRTGEPRKMSFGQWMLPAFRTLSKFRFLRGTPFDPFGYTQERKTERQLIRDYIAMIDELLAKLDTENHHVAVALAAIPEKIRGYGHVKLRHLKAAKAEEAALLEQFRAGPVPMLKAAE
jgi:indolepyruvate ferredoxin oxidoreductase